MRILRLSLSHRNELYQKTRAKASKQSKQRASEVDVSPIHPLLLSQLPASEVSLERVCEDIHAYRPASTVWELERGKGASEVGMRSFPHADDGEEATDAPVVDRAEEGGGEAQGFD